MAVSALIVTAASVQAETVVLALGDSLTQGYGLPAEQGFVPQMERWLRAQGEEVRLINAGVSGDTTAGGAARIEWSLTEEVDAVIVELGGNDLLRGLAPEEARRNLAVILETVTGRNLPVLLVGLPVPGNFGTEYKADFEALFPELAEEYGALYYPSFLAGLSDTASDASELRALMQGDGVHPNAAGVARIVAVMGPKVVELIEATR